MIKRAEAKAEVKYQFVADVTYIFELMKFADQQGKKCEQRLQGSSWLGWYCS